MSGDGMGEFGQIGLNSPILFYFLKDVERYGSPTYVDNDTEAREGSHPEHVAGYHRLCERHFIPPCHNWIRHSVTVPRVRGKKVPRALFMDDIKKRPDHDQECHYNDECPHEDGRHGRRKVCEWIAGKHSRILRLDGF
jgi:hypothetical protein